MYSTSTLGNAGQAVVSPFRQQNNVQYLLTDQPQNGVQQQQQFSNYQGYQRGQTQGNYNEFKQNNVNEGKNDYAKMLDAQIQEKKELKSLQEQLKLGNGNKNGNNMNIQNSNIPNSMNVKQGNTYQGSMQSVFNAQNNLQRTIPQNQFTQPSSYSGSFASNNNIFLSGSNNLFLNGSNSNSKQQIVPSRFAQIQQHQQSNQEKETFFDKWISAGDKTYTTRPQQYRGLLKKENMADNQIEQKERKQQELNLALQEQIMYKKQKEEMELKQRQVEDAIFLQRLQDQQNNASPSRIQTGQNDGKQIKSLASKADRIQQRNIASRRQELAEGNSDFDGKKQLVRTPVKTSRKVVIQEQQQILVDNTINMPNSGRGQSYDYQQNANQYNNNAYNNQYPNNSMNNNYQPSNSVPPQNMQGYNYQPIVNPYLYYNNSSNPNVIHQNTNQLMTNQNMNQGYPNMNMMDPNQYQMYSNNKNSKASININIANNLLNGNNSAPMYGSQQDLNQSYNRQNYGMQNSIKSNDMRNSAENYELQKKEQQKQMKQLNKEIQSEANLAVAKNSSSKDDFIRNIKKPFTLEDKRAQLASKKSSSFGHMMPYQESPYISQIGNQNVEMPLAYGEQSQQQLLQQQTMLKHQSEFIPNKTFEQYSKKKKQPEFDGIEPIVKNELANTENTQRNIRKSIGDIPNQQEKNDYMFIEEEPKRGITQQEESNLDNEFLDEQQHDGQKKRSLSQQSKPLQSEDNKYLQKESVLEDYLWEVVSRISETDDEHHEEEQIQEIAKIVSIQCNQTQSIAQVSENDYESQRQNQFATRGQQLKEENLQLMLREQEKEELRNRGATSQELKEIDRKFSKALPDEKRQKYNKPIKQDALKNFETEEEIILDSVQGYLQDIESSLLNQIFGSNSSPNKALFKISDLTDEIEEPANQSSSNLVRNPTSQVLGSGTQIKNSTLEKKNLRPHKNQDSSFALNSSDKSQNLGRFTPFPQSQDLRELESKETYLNPEGGRGNLNSQRTGKSTNLAGDLPQNQELGDNSHEDLFHHQKSQEGDHLTFDKSLKNLDRMLLTFKMQ